MKIAILSSIIYSIFFPLFVGLVLTLFASLILDITDLHNDTQKAVIEKHLHIYEEIHNICFNLDTHMLACSWFQFLI
jgi:hypothetical protein